MTAYTTISNLLVAVGGKPFATTIQALRDNLLGALEGDASAHAAGVFVQLRAWEQLALGDSVRASFSGSSTSSTSFQEPVSLEFVQTGQVRIKFSHQGSPAGTSEARILRTRAGATAVVGGTFSTSGLAARAVDVDVIPGDIFSVQHRHTTGGANSSVLSAVTYCVDAASRVIPSGGWFGVLQGNP